MADMATSQPGNAKNVRKRFQDRTISVTLSYPKFFFGLLFGLLLLIWAFIFGVMLGRGHNPEEAVPNLAKVMPAPEKTTEPPSSPEVIKQQDLGYHDTLKGKGEAAAQKTAPQKTPKPEPAKPESPVKPAPQKTPDASRPPQKTPSPANDETVYEYLYQVAASNNKQASEALRKKLEASGLTTRIVESESNGTIWNRILVVFNGTPDDTRMLRDKLAAHGITQVILRGKAPVKR